MKSVHVSTNSAPTAQGIFDLDRELTRDDPAIGKSRNLRATYWRFIPRFVADDNDLMSFERLDNIVNRVIVNLEKTVRGNDESK